MPIPQIITRDNILAVINQINLGRQIPIRRHARRVALTNNGINYPVKIIISWAYELSTGQELPYNSFITQEAKRYLEDLGFNIIDI